MGLAIFGKVPSRGDFIKHGIQGTALVETEKWFFESSQDLFGAGARLPDEPFKMVLTQPSWSEVVVSVAVPSRDTVGRSFPLVACATLDAPALRGQSWLAPMLVGPFLQQAGGRLAEAATAGDVDRLVAELGAVTLGHKIELAAAENAFERIMANQRTTDFEARVFDPPEVRFYAYQTLGLACKTIGSGGREAGLSVGCPVTQPEDLLIWNALAGALMGQGVPMIWREGETPRLLLLLGQPPAAALRCVGDENCSARSYWPLTTSHHGAMTAAQQALAGLGFADQPEEAVAGLLDRVGLLAGRARER